MTLAVFQNFQRADGGRHYGKVPHQELGAILSTREAYEPFQAPRTLASSSSGWDPGISPKMARRQIEIGEYPASAVGGMNV
jgi:hypothetical protein